MTHDEQRRLTEKAARQARQTAASARDRIRWFRLLLDRAERSTRESDLIPADGFDALESDYSGLMDAIRDYQLGILIHDFCTKGRWADALTFQNNLETVRAARRVS